MPYRVPGTVLPVHLSISGLLNFSSGTAELTYYSSAPSATTVSTVTPSLGPIRGPALLLATGVNFAPTGADKLKCLLTPLPRPVGWSSALVLVPALYLDYSSVLCNLSANLYAAVGDAMLGVTLDGRAGGAAAPTLHRLDAPPHRACAAPAKNPCTVESLESLEYLESLESPESLEYLEAHLRLEWARPAQA